MTDRQLILADGTALEDCDVYYDGGSAMWIVCPLTLRQGADLFLDEMKTCRMAYGAGGGVQVYTGFTDPQSLNAVPGGLRVMMAGAGAHRETEGA